MRIPLPSCYFAETEDGSHTVIDGVQRITTILKFMNDEFELEDLSKFKSLEGKKFSEIGTYKAELETTTIRCIVLRKENPEELITEIFARLNQGAVKLSDQEIRHALYASDFDSLLQEIAENPIIENFGLGKSGKAKKDSREADELVLRYFAFSENGEKYDGNLSKFLDAFMRDASKYDAVKLESMKTSFQNALNACKAVFSEDEIFTDISSTRRRQGVVYYDLLMNSLSLYNHNDLRKNRKNIRLAFEELCQSSEFKKLTAGGLQRKSSINQRNRIWKDKLETALS